MKYNWKVWCSRKNQMRFSECASILLLHIPKRSHDPNPSWMYSINWDHTPHVLLLTVVKYCKANLLWTPCIEIVLAFRSRKFSDLVFTISILLWYCCRQLWWCGVSFIKELGCWTIKILSSLSNLNFYRLTWLDFTKMLFVSNALLYV